MDPSGLWKMLYLPKLYLHTWHYWLCDEWQMECLADNIADGKAK